METNFPGKHIRVLRKRERFGTLLWVFEGVKVVTVARSADPMDSILLPLLRSFVGACGRSAPWMVIFLAGLPGCVSGAGIDLESCLLPLGFPLRAGEGGATLVRPFPRFGLLVAGLVRLSNNLVGG